MANLLLIDDDQDLVAQNQAVLTARGHDVAAAYNTDDARAALAANVPDAIVLDVMMDTQSAGFTLAREIRQQHPEMPIVMVTGVKDAHELPFEFQPDETWLPVTKLMSKPVDPAALADTIEQMLKDESQ